MQYGRFRIRVAWQLFNPNWISIAAMGGILLLAVGLSDFSLEPMAFGTTVAIAAGLALDRPIDAWRQNRLIRSERTVAIGRLIPSV